METVQRKAQEIRMSKIDSQSEDQLWPRSRAVLYRLPFRATLSAREKAMCGASYIPSTYFHESQLSQHGITELVASTHIEIALAIIPSSDCLICCIDLIP